jgi:nucleoside-diphosphate-sugar epimerase
MSPLLWQIRYFEPRDATRREREGLPDARLTAGLGLCFGAVMRILVAGASGVLGRATLPHLEGHDVVGLTRTPAKLNILHALGAEARVCDVYEYSDLLAVTEEARPQIVVNFLTDLAAGSEQRNNRIRREGAANVLQAATLVGATRLVVGSVAFRLAGDAARAVEQLEHETRRFPGEALILRFGRLWGPGTFHARRPEPPSVEIHKAGAEAARLITDARPGTYIVT